MNLWSGVPLKTFERDIDNPNNRYYRLFHGHPLERLLLAALMPWHVVRPDLIIATSPETRDITCRAFDLPPERVDVTGFPRNDRLFEPAGTDELPATLRKAIASGERLLLYLPTFRDSGHPFMDFDWHQMDRLLGEIGCRLLIKFHPVDPNRLEGEFQHIDTAPRDIDVYALLPHAAALVSDYSSIIWDYMLLKRPIVYFVPDLEDFIATSRSLNFDVMEIAVGPVCRDFDELLSTIAALDRQPDPWHETAHGRKVLERLHTHVDGRASERVLASIHRRVRLSFSD